MVIYLLNKFVSKEKLIQHKIKLIIRDNSSV